MKMSDICSRHPMRAKERMHLLQELSVLTGRPSAPSFKIVPGMKLRRVVSGLVFFSYIEPIFFYRNNFVATLSGVQVNVFPFFQPRILTFAGIWDLGMALK